MKYLFFDIECASVRNGSKICSFGYLLADENLNIIETDDIIVNPNSEWDFYALKNILAFSKEYYESFPTFDKQYERIKKLFEGDVIALGHGVTNDVRFINDDCKRYKLPYIDFVYYDGAVIYKEFENSKEVKSLEKVSSVLSSHKQGDKHESKEDAVLVYEYIKQICLKMGCTMEELLSMVRKSRGENKEGTRYESSNKQNRMNSKKSGNKLYDYFIKHVTPNTECEDRFLENKKIAISPSFEHKRFKEMLLIIQLIANLGGKYTLDAKEADIFVKCEDYKENGRVEYCYKEEIVDERIANGKNIKKIEINRFLEMINYNDEDKEENYRKVIEKISKLIKKEKVKSL